MASATNSSQSSPVPSGSRRPSWAIRKVRSSGPGGRTRHALVFPIDERSASFFGHGMFMLGIPKKNWWEHDDHPFKPVAHHWQNHISAISNSIVSCWVVLCPGPTRGTQQSNWQDYYVDFVKMIQRNVKTGAVPRGSEFFNWIPNIWP